MRGSGAERYGGGCSALQLAVDGPEFDGHQVDFGELMDRLQAYVDKEAVANDLWAKEHGGAK